MKRSLLFALLLIPLQNSPPAITVQPSNASVEAGTTTSFTVSVSGSPVPACQWQASANLGTAWVNLLDFGSFSGVTTNTLTVSRATIALSGYQFRCVATNIAGSATSNAASLTVTMAVPASPPVSGNWTGLTDQGKPFSFTVNGSTNISPLDYGYDTCQDLPATRHISSVIPISANSVSFGDSETCPNTQMLGTFTSSTASGELTLTFSGGSCPCLRIIGLLGWTATSPDFGPFIAVHPVDQTVNEGQNAQFAAAADGNPAPSYRWEVSLDGGSTWTAVPNAAPYAGATSATLTVTSVTADLAGAQYRVIAHNTAGSDAASNAATLTINGIPRRIRGQITSQ